MAHEPTHPASPTPVFSDPSGRRASALRRLSWVLCAAFVAIVAAVGFTLVTQVPLPGLGALLPTAPEASVPRVTPAEKAGADPGDRGRDEIATLRTSGREARLDTRVAETVPDRNGEAGSGPTARPRSDQQSASAAAPAATPSPAAPGTPSENAGPQVTARERNPQAAPKKPSPTADSTDNAHPATGHGSTAATPGATTAPGQNK